MIKQANARFDECGAEIFIHFETRFKINKNSPQD